MEEKILTEQTEEEILTEQTEEELFDTSFDDMTQESTVEPFTDEEINLLTEELENSVVSDEENIENTETSSEIVNEYIYEVDLTNVETLLEQSLIVQQHQYATTLWAYGVGGAILVCILLYKFIKLFY